MKRNIKRQRTAKRPPVSAELLKQHREYEQYLNDTYAEDFVLENAIEALSYLTVQKRQGKYLSAPALQRAYSERTLGTMVKRYDPTAFYAGFNDWKGVKK